MQGSQNYRYEMLNIWFDFLLNAKKVSQLSRIVHMLKLDRKIYLFLIFPGSDFSRSAFQYWHRENCVTVTWRLIDQLIGQPFS